MSADLAGNAKAKDWHSSKHISRRAYYLLEHPDEEIPSDVSFLVGDGQNEPQKTFKCHTFLLAMVSSMFQRMFYGSIPETQDPIKIPDITPTAFSCMLRFAYGEYIESVDVGSVENALDTLYCAKKYMIDQLARISRDRIHLLLGTFQEDPCVVFQRALQMDEDELAALALTRIALNTREVLQGARHLPGWVEHNVEAVKGWTLRNAFGSLLYSIRFPLFTLPELTDGPLTDGILSGEEASSISQLLLAEGNPVAPFPITPRSPLPAPLMCTFERLSDIASMHKLPACFRPTRATDLQQYSTRLLLEARPDLAPECCAFLQRLLEDKFNVGIAFYGSWHPASRCMRYPANDAEVTAAIVDERSVVPHSVKGACWFEWEAILYDSRYYVRIAVGRKPLLHHSAVFGFLLGWESDEQQLEPFELWDAKRVEELASFRMSLSHIALKSFRYYLDSFPVSGFFESGWFSSLCV